MTEEESKEIKQQIEELKENDETNVNKYGIIDYDQFMHKILMKYRILINRTKAYVVNAFNACDLDGF